MKYSEIKQITELTKNGVTYSVFVAHKSNRVSDSRQYLNNSPIEEKPILPKYVKKFMDEHPPIISSCEEWNGDNYTHYLYK